MRDLMETGIWYWYNKQVSMEVGGLTVHNGVSRVRPIIFLCHIIASILSA